MRLFRILAAAIVCLTRTTTTVVTASPTGGTTTRTVVYGFGDRQVGWAHPQVRPSRATFGLAGEDGVKRIRWHD
jgi:hypothetical protein